MIGTLWIANFDYICFDKGDILMVTKYFRCNVTGKMYLCFTTHENTNSTWREEWIGEKFQRLEIQ